MRIDAAVADGESLLVRKKNPVAFHVRGEHENGGNYARALSADAGGKDMEGVRKFSERRRASGEQCRNLKQITARCWLLAARFSRDNHFLKRRASFHFRTSAV